MGAAAALAQASRVVLLMPDADLTRVIDVLLERMRHDPDLVAHVAEIDAFLIEFGPIVEDQL